MMTISISTDVSLPAGLLATLGSHGPSDREGRNAVKVPTLGPRLTTTEGKRQIEDLFKRRAFIF